MPESTLLSCEAVASCGGTLEAPMPELEVIDRETKSDTYITDLHELGIPHQNASEPSAERVPLLVATSSGHESSSAECSTTSSTEGFIDISIANGGEQEHQSVCNNQAINEHSNPAPSGRIQAAGFLLCKLRR